MKTRRLKTRGSKYSSKKTPKFKLSREAINLFSYWRDSLVDGGQSSMLSEGDGDTQQTSILVSNSDIGFSRTLLRLYNEILDGKRQAGLAALLAKLKEPKRKQYPQSLRSLRRAARKHCGQFEGRFALSNSQRTAIHRYFELGACDLLCVTGPPGTGKTTFLQSIIASEWVSRALIKNAKPAIILACSETNQAVTNIIDSFKPIAQPKTLLEQRWLPGIRSYGSFCCSESKSHESSDYQLELRDGSGFSAQMECYEYLEQANKYFLKRVQEYTQTKLSLSKAVTSLRRELLKEYKMLSRDINDRCEGSLSSWFTRIISKSEVASDQDFFKMLEPLDTSRRYRLFLLATHYWEARWLLELRNDLSKLASYSEARESFRGEPKDWQRRAMITPVFVSTLSMAASFFGSRPQNGDPFIDLMIFDEAGQISPEMAVACCSLTKKGVVVGDTMQLEPYRRISEQRDLSNLKKNRLLKEDDAKTLSSLKRRGILASANSFMELAIRSSYYEEKNSIGVFLSEHRRCVPALVTFCNHLAYYGRLKPMRSDLSQRVLPIFGFANIAGKSEQRGPSRINQMEVQRIVWWLEKNAERLRQFYRGNPLNSIIAVITPFTAQSHLLKDRLARLYPGMIIGTVNSLQGAERPIVIFSSVYDGTFKGQYFFDRNPNFLNVAVSRSKDSFIVFGDMTIFDPKGDMPSSLLAKYLFYRPENEIFVDPK